MGGWVKVFRIINEKAIGQKGNFVLGVFTRLLLMANWKKSDAIWNGQKITIAPGQLITSLKELSPNHDEDPYLNRIRGVLKFLVDAQTIELSTHKHGTLITICNWEVYQSEEENSTHDTTIQSLSDHYPTTQYKEVKKKRREEGNVSFPLVDLWNRNRGKLPGVKGCSGKRLAAAHARWNEKPDSNYWTDIIKRMAKSDFCCGRKNQPGPHSSWKADFDFLIKPETQFKILEGKFDNLKPTFQIVNLEQA